MRVFKKIAAIAAVAAMSFATLAGCTKNSSTTPAGGDATKPGSEQTDAPKADEGKVLNIYCWNTEFQVRVEDFYPGYEKVDATTGKIGDVTVKFHITANENNAYQDNLDSVLLANDKADADDQIDMFLVEADYALKYTDTEYAADLSKLGITDADLSTQYQYTKDIMKDSNGALKGLSWQGCPGVFIYNKEIATKVLGSDDPEKVQEAVKDWDTFDKTAVDMKKNNFYMLAGYEDDYRVFSNNMDTKWVVDNKLNLDDPSIKQWVDQTKEYTDKGYNKKGILWDPDWKANFAKGQDVFGYFGPAWFVDYTLAQKDDDGNYTNADTWSICPGPAGYYWGGTWLCASSTTDNPTLVKDLMLTMTTDKDVLVQIVKKYNDFVNNSEAMDEMATDETYKSDFLGINPIPYYKELVGNIQLDNLTPYDQGCNEEFQKAMRGYFNGDSTYDEAIEAFKQAIKIKYPTLDVE